MRHVPADGRFDAPIVLIGESPGTHEQTEGKPFVGPSGHRLSKWWADVGLSRSDIYITNVVPYFYGPTTESLSQVPDLRPHFASLARELARLTNPKVIVPCGNLALAALWQTGLFKLFEGKPKLPETPIPGSCPICAAPPGGPCKRKNGYKANPKTRRHAPDAIPAPAKSTKLPKYKPITASTAKQAASISNWRGSILPFHMPGGRLVKLIPTLHPAATLHAPTLEGCCRHDWRRIASEVATPGLVLPERRHVIRPTLADLDHFASAWWSALVSSPSTAYLVADLETTRPGHRHHPRIKCVGLSFDPSWSLVVPWGEDYWGFRWPTVYQWLKLLLEYEGGSRVVFHNGLFDTFWLAGEGIHLPQWWLDTLALHHCDDPVDAHDLAYLASILTREPYWKDPGDSLEELWLYCGTDACVTREILDPLLDKLRRDGRLDFYRQYYAALFAPLLRLSREGMPVDNERRERVAVALKVKQVELKAALLDGAGQDTLFGGRGGLSNKKLLVYFSKRNLPTQYNRKTGRPTADETAIRNLMRKFPEQARDLGQRILDLRETAKTLEFLAEERVDEDGHFRSSFAPYAESCRLRSSANAYGTGSNATNIPARPIDVAGEHFDVRSIFVPAPGCVWLEVDLSRIEDRLVKMLTQTARLIAQACLPPDQGDVHRLAAAEIFGVRPEDVTKQQRDLGKRVVHACVTPAAEVLTKQGWLPIEKARDQAEAIHVWVPEGIASCYHEEPYEVPSAWYTYPYAGDLVEIQGPGFYQRVTPEHRVIYKAPQAAGGAIGWCWASTLGREEHAVLDLLRLPTVIPTGPVTTDWTYITGVRRTYYTGPVLCPTVLTGAFLIREHGCISACGNSNYSMGPQTFHDNLVDEGVFMSIPECRRLLQARAAANPEVGNWQMRTRIEINEYRYLTGIFGHIWRVPWERMEGDLFRRAYAFRPQNGAATLLNQRGFVPLDAAIESGRFPGARLCNNIHDAVLVSAPAAVAYDVAAFLMEHLEQPLEVCGAPLAVYAELKVGHSWAKSDCTEFKRLPSRDVFEAAVVSHMEARR